MNHPRLRTLAGTLLVAALAAGALFAAPLSATAAPVTLSGVVTGPTGTALPAASIEILAVAADGELASSGTVTSSATGTFVLPGLPAGEYTLRFGATATTHRQYLGKTSVAAEAQVIDLIDAAGGTPFISANLAAGGMLRGSVRTATGAAVPKYTVTAYGSTGDALATAVTTAAGSYAFPTLEAGAYRVGVADMVSAVPAFGPVFSGPSSSLAHATEVSVTTGAISTQNFTLGGAARISGILRGDCPDAVCAAGATTETLAGVLVTPYRITLIEGAYVYERLSSAARTTSATGAFALTGLAPGDYTLRLSPRGAAAASGTIYGERYLAGADSALSAKRLKVAPGAIVAGLTDTLTPSSTITATFSDGTNPVAHLRVRLSLYADTEYRTISEGFTDTAGGITLTGAATGSYRIAYGSHIDVPGDAIVENTTFEAGETPVYSFAGNPVSAPPVTLIPKDPLGLHPISTLTISTGDPTVGGFATIAGGLYNWNSPNVTASVQWLRNGEVIPGATGNGYTFRGADAGELISARITGRNVAYGSGTIVTAATSFIGTGTLSSSQDASMTGSAVVGTTLTLAPTQFYTPGAVSSIAWERVGLAGLPEVIAGETGTSHVVSAQDLVFDDTAHSRVRAHVTVTRQGYSPLSYSVDSALVTEGTLAQSKGPVVSATATTFTAKSPVVAPAATTDFTWVVYDSAGAPTATSFGPTLSRAGKSGKKITVSVRTQRPGYTPRLTLLVAQYAPAPTATGALAITGSAMVDSPLSAPAVTFAPALDKSVGYQWSALTGTTWKNIPGATAASFTPTGVQKGHRLRVVLTGASTGYLTRTVISTATSPVAAGSGLAVTTEPVISGSVGYNRTISVSTGAWTPTPTAYSYQWKTSSNGTTWLPITGATKANYLIPASALGKSFAVTVTASRVGYPGASTTVLAGAVTGGTIKNLTPPKFTEVSPNHYKVTSNGTWSHPATGFSYIWVYSQPLTGAISVDSPVFSSDSSNQQVFDAGVDTTSRWMLVVRALGTAGSSGDSAPIEVRKGVMQHNGTFILSDPAVMVGTSVSATAVNWKTLGASTISTQWQITSSTDPTPAPESWTNVAGATSLKLALSPAMVDKTIRVRITGRAPGYRDTVAYSAIRYVFPGESPAIPSGANAVTILGSPSVGSPSTYHKATFPAGWTAAYEWWATTANGWASQGKGLSYTPTEPGSLVVVKVAVTRPGFTTLQISSPLKMVANGSVTPVTQPVVSKSSSGAYTVTTGSYAPASTVLSYRWSVTQPDGIETLVSTSGPTYTPTANHDGKLLSVELSISSGNPLYNSLTITKVARVATTAIQWTSEPYLSGSHHVGETLTLGGGTWSMSSPVLEYTWKRSGVVIPGATGASYTATPADIGKVLSLTVTASRANFGSAAKILTAPSVTLSDVLLTPTSDPTLTGIGVVGSTLVAQPGSWNQPGLTLGYQWQRNGAPIAGATGASYTASGQDFGQDISVRVTAGKANYYHSAQATSSAIYIEAGTFAGTGTVTLATPFTDLKSGKPLNVTVAGWAKNATLTFQWEHSDDGTAYAPIIGATGKTFTATPATAGYTRVTVTASAPGYTTQVARTDGFRVNP